MPHTSALLLYCCGSRPGLSCSARPSVLASSALCRMSEHIAAASALLLARWRISQYFTCLMMSHLHCPGNEGASTDPESPTVRGSSAPLDGPPSVPQTRHQPCIPKRRFQRAVECGETSATRCLEARLPPPGSAYLNDERDPQAAAIRNERSRTSPLIMGSGFIMGNGMSRHDFRPR